MKKIILTLLLGLGAINTAAALEGNAEAGKAKSVMCGACHGADGNSLVPMYPKLAGQSAIYIAKQLAEFKAGVMSGGKEGRIDPVMGGMTMALSEQDMMDLGAYYQAQTSTAGNGSADALGKSLYLSGDAERGITACIACHSFDGHGMPSAGFPAVASQNVDYLKGQLSKFRDGSRANDNNAMMRNIAIKLEDADIAALTQYMSSLK
ncbi:MAG: cytochrome c553 [Alteromonadaceae bacterium]|jgi:cytochrome c553